MSRHFWRISERREMQSIARRRSIPIVALFGCFADTVPRRSRRRGPAKIQTDSPQTAVWVCTYSTSRVSASGSVSGSTP